MTAQFFGGPNDGQTFTHDDGTISVYTCTVDNGLAETHLYDATDESRTVFAYRGVESRWRVF